MASHNYQPTPENKSRYKFTFGLWTFRHRGADPFGEPTKPVIPVQEGIRGLAERNVYGFNFHDDDLVPFGSSATERDAIVRETERTMKNHDIVCPMATTNLFYQDVFKDGAFTSSDPKIRAYAVRKAMRGIDLGVSLGAKIYVFWGGREGSEVDAAKDPMDALKWNREALNFLSHYVKEQAKHDSAYIGLVFALEAKPNEPRGDIYLATTGHMLGFISTLDNQEMIGVNPEFGHELMAGLNFYHTLAQAKDAKKLFHVDLNSQRPLRFDEDRRFGAQVIQDAFWVVRALESGYDGPRHYDCHPYRPENIDGAWDFVE
ncbi:MAG: TIM barrel protein, partial [Acidobacteria bacterium]|nr:TIM barrel protein [Acidobacteriota bacterium]